MSSSVCPPRTAAASPTASAQDAGLTSELAVYASLQSSAQFADAKVGVLGAVQAGLMVAAVPQGDVVREAWDRGGYSGWTAVLLLGLHVAVFLPAVYHVVQALRPRLGPPPSPNRFSLPLLATMGSAVPPPGQDRERQELWQLIPVLAKVVMAKHRHIVRGVVWTGLMAVVAALSFLTGPLLA